jgi:hypothetical protein
VAVRPELFVMVKYKPLADLSENAFLRRCEHYGVGQAGRAGGTRAVILDPAFLEPLWFDVGGEGDGQNPPPGDSS